MSSVRSDPKGFRRATLALMYLLTQAGFQTSTPVKVRVDTPAPKRRETRIGQSYPWCMKHQRYCRPGGRKHKSGMTHGHVQAGGQPY